VPHGGLRTVCQKADALRPAMLASLRAEARSEILAALKGIALGEAILGTEEGVDQQTARLVACQNVARPKVVDCAGCQRLLAVLPESDANAPLTAALGKLLDPPPTILADTDADLMLCYEQQELSLPHVAARLIAGRNDYTEIAARLHTRADVAWTELPSPGDRAAPKSPAKAAAEESAAAFPVVTMTQPNPSQPAAP